MTADLLRQAAALMRLRAEGATPGPWVDEYSGATGPCVIPFDAQDARESIARCHLLAAGMDAAHIASWHPTVAIAVANWLETEADLGDTEDGTVLQAGILLARAYLGRDA